jgi:hypothetical protein
MAVKLNLDVQRASRRAAVDPCGPIAFEVTRH